MENTFGEYVIYSVIFLFYVELSKVVHCQPVVDEEFYYAEHCTGPGGYTKGQEDLQKQIDFIMNELHEQNQENILLKKEVQDLQTKTTEQKRLLIQITDTMRALVEKLKAGKEQPCSCDKQPGSRDETVSVDSTNSLTTRAENITTQSVTLPYLTEESPTNIAIKLQTSIQTPITDADTIFDDVSVEYELRDYDTKSLESRTSLIPVYPRDCQAVSDAGKRLNKTYTIMPINASEPFRTYCEMHDNEAWTVVQRRQDGSVDFYRNWTDYKEGFGDAEEEFWIGNEKLHQLTRQGTYKLRIDMWDWIGSSGSFYYAESDYIDIGGEDAFYILNAPDGYFSYSGFGGSGLRVHRGPFMTFDKQDPGLISQNCAEKFHCGWWFKTCVRNANLNGKYYTGGYSNVTTKSREMDDLYWPNINQSLRKVVMKIRRVKDEPFSANTKT